MTDSNILVEPAPVQTFDLTIDEWVTIMFTAERRAEHLQSILQNCACADGAAEVVHPLIQEGLQLNRRIEDKARKILDAMEHGTIVQVVAIPF
jgi:hypothetical protein